jgi:hypothetical protein
MGIGKDFEHRRNTNKKSGRCYVRIEKDMRERFASFANEHSLSGAVNKLVRKALEGNK